MCPCSNTVVAASVPDPYLVDLSTKNTDLLLQIQAALTAEGYSSTIDNAYSTLNGVALAALTFNADNSQHLISNVLLPTDSRLTLIKSRIAQIVNGVETLELTDTSELDRYDLDAAQASAKLNGLSYYYPYGSTIFTSGNYATAEEDIIHTLAPTKNANLSVSRYAFTLVSSDLATYQQSVKKQARYRSVPETTRNDDTQSIIDAYYSLLALGIPGLSLELSNTGLTPTILFGGSADAILAMKLPVDSNVSFDQINVYVPSATGELQAVNVPISQLSEQGAKVSRSAAKNAGALSYPPFSGAGWTSNIAATADAVSGQYKFVDGTFGKPKSFSGVIRPQCCCSSCCVCGWNLCMC